MSAGTPLFPAIEPYRTGSLRVSELHTLYFEEVGRPDGCPILFLHGGPGGGLEPVYRRFFDPGFYRVVLFDQRGCGRSTPHAELRENTTWDLVADIERLREHLGIDAWAVFGGSWGSTLALAYAETHPERVRALVLRGVYLGRRWEHDWYFAEGGVASLFPEEWERFMELVPPEQRQDTAGAYYRLLTGDDAELARRAARAWTRWETAAATLLPPRDLELELSDPLLNLAVARLECHYFVNDVFLESEDQLLVDASRLVHLPCKIVNGRYDVICPPRSAWELHRRLPASELVIVPDAGHAPTEPGTRATLVRFTQELKKILV